MCAGWENEGKAGLYNGDAFFAARWYAEYLESTNDGIEFVKVPAIHNGQNVERVAAISSRATYNAWSWDHEKAGCV
jgi:hypothetical protein